jgi:hypothetical protein
MAFISLFLMGFTVIFGLMSFYYKELRANNYSLSMSVANGINCIVLFLIVIVYTFVYAGDTKLIRKFKFCILELFQNLTFC